MKVPQPFPYQGSKRNLARIQEWYEDSPDLHRTLAGLRKAGALDIGEV